MARTKHWQDTVSGAGFLIAGSISIIIVALIFVFLLKEAYPFAIDPGLSELIATRWIPVSFQRETYGLIPLLTGSLLVTVLGTLIAVPFGVLGAIYVAELATPAEREFLKPVVELLAGIPSVVLGFFGLQIVAPIVKNIFGLSSGLTALTGALLLAFMAIPTIMSISEDALRNVPRSFKDASLALGASELVTIFNVTVPAALSGIIAAIMLGMGRVIGETMAVLMVTGNAAVISLSPFDSVRTMTATVAAEMGEVAFGGNHYRALFCVGVVLLIITFCVNTFAQLVLGRYREA